MNSQISPEFCKMSVLACPDRTLAAVSSVCSVGLSWLHHWLPMSILIIALITEDILREVNMDLFLQISSSLPSGKRRGHMILCLIIITIPYVSVPITITDTICKCPDYYYRYHT